MPDRPDAAALLRGMAATLTDDVMPATNGGARHAVRVVANLCRILEREVRDGGAGAEETRRALAELLGHDEPLDALVERLDARLAAHPDDVDFERRARDVLMGDARRRLAIDKPGYEA